MIIGKSRTNQPVNAEQDVIEGLIADAVDDYLEENPVDITALEGQTIEPENVYATGKMTADEIVENMSGYSFTPTTGTNLTYEYVYAGVCKNGNKLTFALAMNITKTDTVSSLQELGRFTIPASVFNKLYPTTIGPYASILDFKVLNAIKSNGVSDLNVLVDKSGATTIIIYGQGASLDTLTQDAKYFVRLESTFLLSNNLVPEE